MLALAIGFWRSTPGAVLVSHAETETVAAAADPAGAETASEDDGTTFLLSFLGNHSADPLRRRDCHCNCHQYGGSCRSTGRQ